MHSSVKDIPNSTSTLYTSLNNLGNWSSTSNLASNPKKTETVLFSTYQLAKVHSLDSWQLDLEISGRTLKPVTNKMLLDVEIEIVFDPLPQYLMRGLQCMQNAAASFVLGPYANPTDCINIRWLPVVQRRKLYLLKATFKALNDPHWPYCAAISKLSQACLTVVAFLGGRRTVIELLFGRNPRNSNSCV